jgi:hypothetical protein
LKSFFGWLAQDTRAANIMEGMKIKTPGMADVPVLSEAQLKALLGSLQGKVARSVRGRALHVTQHHVTRQARRVAGGIRAGHLHVPILEDSREPPPVVLRYRSSPKHSEPI